jgi:hypothetical protein
VGFSRLEKTLAAAMSFSCTAVPLVMVVESLTTTTGGLAASSLIEAADPRLRNEPYEPSMRADLLVVFD